MSERVTVVVRDSIGLIAVDNPPVNAMSNAVITALKESVDQIGADPEAKALVLVGKGEKAFLAGAQIEEFREFMADPESLAARLEVSRALFDGLADMDKPTVAAIQASAAGGGLELALACDFIVADPAAKLGLPEVKLGVIAGGGGTQRLPRRIGVGAAKDLLLRGQMIDAEKGYRLGLVNEVSEPGKALDAAFALAREVAAPDPRSIAAVKRGIAGNR